ncbi:NAD(P)/FAD-dependent oxidoreductase [Agrobacterium leguminum]|uniref:NAD(P)/FAD-dependent oxidoreductase n=1 Tax=Agrobacterium leguminum TaxID=2792015 RepID=UPI0030CC22E8
MSAHRVVVVGAGFGGTTLVDALRGANLEITLIDQRNHHLFQPLLYQVATASEVVDVNVGAKAVSLSDGRTIPYDTLVLATGATHAYFGHEEWAKTAPGLKTVEDALEIRKRILMAFEKAENASNADERAAYLTFAVIGGGPTGVELAGMIAEIRNSSIAREFRNIDTRQARVLLLEAGPRVLANFREDLGRYVEKALARRGVEILTGEAVTNCSADRIKVGNRFIPSRTVIWAAGVKASPAASWLKVSADRAGRIIVGECLEVPGHSDIYAIGDTTSAKRPDGKPVPGVAPAAKQQGKYVARLIRKRLSGSTDYSPFTYRDQGNLATIGKRAAVIDFGWIRLRGWMAWWIWGGAHILFLVGVRSRMAVAWKWLWVHLRGQRNARLITGK